jgi:hypothetical protein
MPLYKSILAAFLVFAAAVHAQEAKCPSHQGNQPLTRVSVFDGPPAQHADLAPDDQKGSGDHLYLTWEIAYLFGMNHDVFLVCRYSPSADEPSVTIKLDKKVSKCVFRSHGSAQPAEVECK